MKSLKGINNKVPPINTKKMLLIILTTMVLILIYLTFSSKEYHTNIIFHHNNQTKYILYWSPLKKSMGFEPFKNCEYKNCYETDKRYILPLEKFDALIFSFNNNYKLTLDGVVPWIRSPHQIYVYMNTEPPVNGYPDLDQYKNYFNWTMTYRFDSELIKRKGMVIKGETNYTMPSEEFLQNKKLVAWFENNNCKTSSKRENLVKEIQKYIPVDVYGRCGDLPVPESSLECFDMIEKNYKFYFSFEDSYCEDYSTENLYNALKRNIIPVVYGKGDYIPSGPPNSIINIGDFKEIQTFVDFLKNLDQNHEEYLKYFEWKKNYQIIQPSHACEMCKKLHQPIKEIIYSDIKKWWVGEGNFICEEGKDLPEIVPEFLPEEEFSTKISDEEEDKKIFNSIMKWFVP